MVASGESVSISAAVLVAWSLALLRFRGVLSVEESPAFVLCWLLLVPWALCGVSWATEIPELGRERDFAKIIPVLLFGLALLLVRKCGPLEEPMVTQLISLVLVAVLLGSLAPYVVAYLCPASASARARRNLSSGLLSLQAVAFAIMALPLLVPILHEARK